MFVCVLNTVLTLRPNYMVLIYNSGLYFPSNHNVLAVCNCLITEDRLSEFVSENTKHVFVYFLLHCHTRYSTVLTTPAVLLLESPRSSGTLNFTLTLIVVTESTQPFGFRFVPRFMFSYLHLFRIKEKSIKTVQSERSSKVYKHT